MCNIVHQWFPCISKRKSFSDYRIDNTFLKYEEFLGYQLCSRTVVFLYHTINYLLSFDHLDGPQPLTSNVIIKQKKTELLSFQINRFVD